MPTGYTAGIEDGSITSAKDYIILCARNFGACLDMRDEPLNAPIPDQFEISSYYTRSLEEAQSALKIWNDIKPEEAHMRYEAEIESENGYAERRIDEQMEQYKAYRKILKGVRDWNPPTPEHEGLKKFAIDQINMCANSDISYWQDKIDKGHKPFDAWWDDKIKSTEEEIKRYKKEVDEEKKRNESRNNWIKQLRESLK